MNLTRLQDKMRLWLETGDPDYLADFDASARPGLDVYLNNYRTQLLSCLERTFPFTRIWIGEEQFQVAARKHIMATPPRSWSVDEYSHTFAAKASIIFPNHPLAVELAQLEQAISDAQTAKNSTPLTREMIAEVDWENTALTCAPGTQVLRHESNAAEIWSALSRGDYPPLTKKNIEPINILIWRCRFVPCFRPLDHDEAEFFTAMAKPLQFATICAILESKLGAEAAIARAGLLLARWIDDEAVSIVEVNYDG